MVSAPDKNIKYNNWKKNKKETKKSVNQIYKILLHVKTPDNS